MTTGKILMIMGLAVFLGMATAFLGRQWLSHEEAIELPGRVARDGEPPRLERLPRFHLPDIHGEEIDSSRWSGKILVLNFWATWCPPCLRELPLFDELQRARGDAGLQIVGIAIDEKEEVADFLAKHPVTFPILLGDMAAVEMSRQLGNQMEGLPFTVVFDQDGKRVFGQTGEMTRASLSEHLDSLLQRSDGKKASEN